MVRSAQFIYSLDIAIGFGAIEISHTAPSSPWGSCLAFSVRRISIWMTPSLPSFWALRASGMMKVIRQADFDSCSWCCCCQSFACCCHFDDDGWWWWWCFTLFVRQLWSDAWSRCGIAIFVWSQKKIFTVMPNRSDLQSQSLIGYYNKGLCLVAHP